MLSMPDHWVWDFWIADDADDYHIYFLHAPKSLGDDHRRHRAARIGHAVSRDLVTWTHLGTIFEPGDAGSFDAIATWTGSVVRGPDGRWRMFYTVSRFLAPEPDHANIETIGVAVSDDLFRWEKQPGPIVTADDRWYEVLGTSTWPEEAWRDPWVFADPNGTGWHMLITARANSGSDDDRGVIGHAFSADLDDWEVRPPISQPGSGFAHLEVPQVVQVGGRWFLLFACPAESLSAAHRVIHPRAGTWSIAIDDPRGPLDVSDAVPLTDFTRYSGRLVQQRDGSWVLLTFENAAAGDPFPGVIGDPTPVAVADGRLVLADRHLVGAGLHTSTTAAGSAAEHRDGTPCTTHPMTDDQEENT